MMLIGIHEKTPFKAKDWKTYFSTCSKCTAVLNGMAYKKDSTVLCSECMEAKLLPEFEQITIQPRFPLPDKADIYNGETVFYGLKKNYILNLPGINTLERFDGKKVFIIAAIIINLLFAETK